MKEKLSTFWSLWFAIISTLLIYFSLLGINTNSFTVYATSMLFLVLLIMAFTVTMAVHLGYIPSKYFMPMGKSFGESALAFLAGCIFWMLIIPQQPETIKTTFFDWFMDAIVAPFVEEYWFALSLPAIIYFVLSKLTPLNESDLIIATSILAGLIFAYTHVAMNHFPLFIASALVFRALLINIYEADVRRNLLPFINVTPAFLFGVHFMNNNIYLMGNIQNTITFLLAAGTLGKIFLTIFAIIVIYAIFELMEK